MNHGAEISHGLRQKGSIPKPSDEGFWVKDGKTAGQECNGRGHSLRLLKRRAVGAKQGKGSAAPWFYRLCSAVALCGKKSISSDLIFWILFYQEKSIWAPRPRAGQAMCVKGLTKR